jgi:hypothetical protein
VDDNVPSNSGGIGNGLRLVRQARQEAPEINDLTRLSTRHGTRQDEVDELLRNEVLVDRALGMIADLSSIPPLTLY